MPQSVPNFATWPRDSRCRASASASSPRCSATKPSSVRMLGRCGGGASSACFLDVRPSTSRRWVSARSRSPSLRAAKDSPIMAKICPSWWPCSTVSRSARSQSSLAPVYSPRCSAIQPSQDSRPATSVHSPSSSAMCCPSRCSRWARSRSPVISASAPSQPVASSWPQRSPSSPNSSALRSLSRPSVARSPRTCASLPRVARTAAVPHRSPSSWNVGRARLTRCSATARSPMPMPA